MSRKHPSGKTSTASKRKYNERVYTRIDLAIPKELAAQFWVKSHMNSVSMRSVIAERDCGRIFDCPCAGRDGNERKGLSRNGHLLLDYMRGCPQILRKILKGVFCVDIIRFKGYNDENSFMNRRTG